MASGTDKLKIIYLCNLREIKMYQTKLIFLLSISNILNIIFWSHPYGTGNVKINFFTVTEYMSYLLLAMS